MLAAEERSDHLDRLGALALASRLRRLSDQLMGDIVRIYRHHDLAFEPRWFGLFHLLGERQPLSIREAADALGVSHTSISQTVRELRRAKLLSATRDPRDGRRRRLTLTARGEALLHELEPLWQDCRSGAQDLLDEAGGTLLSVLGALERALDRRSLQRRVLAAVRAEPSRSQPPRRREGERGRS
jgi:DNA-binding MarR family transcriptional regulator